MSRREKILLGLVVGTLVLGFGLKVFRSQVLDRLERMDRGIVAREAEIRKINTQKSFLRGQRALWYEMSAQTLSTDVAESRVKLLFELTALAKQHGLENPSVTPSDARPFLSGLVPLPITIDATGTLFQIVSFLHALHTQPFMVETRSVRLVPGGEKEGAKIRLTVKGESIVLPPHKLAPDVRTLVMKPREQWSPTTRTAFVEPAKYLAIAEKHIFERYKAPPPPPPPKVENKEERPEVIVKKEEERPPPPSRKFHPARTSTRLTALIGTPDRQEVVITGTDKKRTIVKVGEEFDGGTLVFVHPEGAVVVYNDEKDFYPAGKLLSEMKILTEDENPEVFSIVSRMEKAAEDEKVAARDKGS